MQFVGLFVVKATRLFMTSPRICSIIIQFRNHDFSPMYMYCLNRLRSFFRDESPNRRASPTHDGIVRSFIPYGANFDDVPFPSRIDFGSCLSGIGY